ncbi:hypothetical protein M2407_005152 [Serratia sp. BIGb0234]|nr:hypothetical protein [Serratia sp. BIGb0234]
MMKLDCIKRFTKGYAIKGHSLTLKHLIVEFFN